MISVFSLVWGPKTLLMKFLFNGLAEPLIVLKILRGTVITLFSRGAKYPQFNNSPRYSVHISKGTE